MLILSRAPRHLHSSLCFVQCPVLFSGTLLDNLDPGRIHTVDEVWAALAAVNLAAFVESRPGSLEMSIASNGRNLSQGQRQLVCLARAMLRRCKV